MITIDRRCTGCGLCIPTCPSQVLLRRPGAPIVRETGCTDCWECIEVCPADAIRSEAE